MKRLLVFVIAVSVTAQTHSIIDFVEWALETRLTPAERAEMRRQPFDAKTIDSLSKVQDQINAMPDDQRETARRKVQDLLLQSLRSPQADHTSRMLLAAYERAHTTGGALPPQMIGDWSKMSTSTVTYQNSAGSYAPPSGEGTTWHIFADGSFRSETLMQSSMYNCTMTIFVTESGAVRTNGSSVVFESVGGPMDSKDNCHREFNYRKTVPPRQYVYFWRVFHDQWGQHLCLAERGKAEECFTKKRD